MTAPALAVSAPELLLLSLPCLLLWLWLLRAQRQAMRELEEQVDAQFRPHLTRHSWLSLHRHLALLLFLALLLVLAAAGPTLTAGRRTTGAPRVLLMIDASASMFAQDVEGQLAALAAPKPGVPDLESSNRATVNAEPPANRLELAKRLAWDLVAAVEDAEVAVLSFSGRPTVHLPMTRRLDQVAVALRTLEGHSHYRNTGSSLAAALGEAFHFVDSSAPGLQVVLLGDGELPTAEDYHEPVAALAQQGVAVHGITIGGVEGRARNILDFHDVVAKVEEPRALSRFTTRRVDEHYQRIAKATAGRFSVAERGVVESLAAAIGAYRPPATDRRGEGEHQIAPYLLLLFAVGFVYEALWLCRPRHRPDFSFDIRRLGEPLALAAFAVVIAQAGCGGNSALELAHRANERGIALDAAAQFTSARSQFERSIAFGVESELPTYNLGRSLIRAGRFAEAREALQRALELAPELTAAYYNDGIALFRLGRQERDPRDCDLTRTQDLWRAARDRFYLTTARATAESGLFESAAANRWAMERELEQLERLIADPPPHCLRPNSSVEGGAGSGAGGGGGDQHSKASESESSAVPELSPHERETIEQALERIASQAFESGKYHRRTLPEQFPRSAWADPDPELWW